MELAPFTSEYLALYSDGIGLLKRYLESVKVTGPITTEDIEEFLREEREEQVRLV